MMNSLDLNKLSLDTTKSNFSQIRSFLKEMNENGELKQLGLKQIITNTNEVTKLQNLTPENLLAALEHIQESNNNNVTYSKVMAACS